MNSIAFSWPEGKSGAVTTSWDDGTLADRRLAAILTANGVKATWNLNSAKLGMNASQSGWKEYVRADEVPTLFAGHEIAVHTANHPALWQQPDDAIAAEVIEDRRALERLAGIPVRGMALPYGGPDDRRVQAVLTRCGIAYARSIDSTGKFGIPLNFMHWTPTCHVFADAAPLWTKFIESRDPDKLFYLWGHSYEFNDRDAWDTIESFAKLAGERTDIWHATNIAVFEYIAAWRGLQCTVEMTHVRNCSGTTVWLRSRGALTSVGPGQIAQL